MQTPDKALAEEHFEIAELLLARGYARAAVFEAQQGMNLGPPRPEQRVLYAWLLYQRSGAGAYVQDHVWQHLELALKEAPACAAAHYYKGVLLKRSGRLADALTHFERALELDPSDRRAQTELELFSLRTLG
jgi:tetratricopeptide (TPR) repeat protein